MSAENYQKLNTTLIQTLRKKIDELRASEEKFKNIFDNASDGILLAYLSTKKFAVANKTICNMLGYSEDELKNLSVNDIHPKKDLPYVLGEFKKQAQKKISLTTNLPVQRKDGSVFYADINAMPVTFGGKTYLAGIFRDVTERKKIEEELHASEARYKSYIDLTGQIGWVTNAKGEIEEDTPSFRKFTGQTYKEAKGSGWAKALHPDDVARTLKVWHKAVTTKSSYEVEYRLRRHDGVYRNLLARGFPVFRKDGSIHEWVGTCIDITERKKTEEALKESEEKFKTLFEASSDAIMTLAPPTWMFTSGNPATLRMFKAKNEKDFTSRAPWQYSPKYQPNGQLSSVKAKEMIGKAMKTGRNFFEWTHRRLDGEDFFATVLLTRLEIGSTKLLQATVRDITAQKKADAEVKASEMRLVNLVKNRYIAAEKIKNLLKLKSRGKHD
jgi:PAS domain S-box-containing protein